MKAKDAERDEAVKVLRGWLRPGDTVWTDCTHVSASRMSRRIRLFVIRNNEPRNISAYVGRATGMRVERKDLSVVMGGCGMDMGVHAVMLLAAALWPKGFACPGEKRCVCNDHYNERALGGVMRYGKGVKHNRGDYALRQRWLS